MSLIVTGSIGIDSVEAPTGNAEDVLGGSAIYFAAAASFFTPVRLVAAVGDDFPDEYMKTFQQFDVDLEGLETRIGSKTFRWRCKYHENMNQRETLEVALNVLGERLPPVPEAYRDSQFIFLANTDPGSQMSLLEQFPNRKLAVADTMDLWISTHRDKLLGLLGQVDGLVLNNDEAEQMVDESNPAVAAEKICAMGPKFVIVKKGEHGALIEHSGAKAVLPAFPVKQVIDPTGAGDCFAGGMMGYLAATGDLSLNGLRIAMAYGTIVASFNIESFSLDRLKQISRDDVDQRFADYRSMLQISP